MWHPAAADLERCLSAFRVANVGLDRFSQQAQSETDVGLVGASRIANGAVTERGVLFPEQLFAREHYAAFIAELSEKGVSIAYGEETSPQM